MDLFCDTHKPVQYRDGMEPWCPKCGMNARGATPKSLHPSLHTPKIEPIEIVWEDPPQRTTDRRLDEVISQLVLRRGKWGMIATTPGLSFFPWWGPLNGDTDFEVQIVRNDPGKLFGPGRVYARYIGIAVSPDGSPLTLEGPHSRACGINNHPHGPSCARDCPTCLEAKKNNVTNLQDS